MQTKIVIATRDQRLIKLKTPVISAGNRNNDVIELKPDKSWMFNDGTALIMTFYLTTSNVVEVPLVNNICYIPNTLLQAPGVIKFGLAAVKDGQVVKTSELSSYIIVPGTNTSGHVIPDYAAMLQSFKTDFIGTVNTAITTVNGHLLELDEPLTLLNSSMTDTVLQSTLTANLGLMTRVLGYYSEILDDISTINLSLFSEANLTGSIDYDATNDMANISGFVETLKSNYSNIRTSLISNIPGDEITFDSTDTEIITAAQTLIAASTTLIQQNTTLTQQNTTLTQQNTTLTQQNTTLTQQNTALTNERNNVIQSMYNVYTGTGGTGNVINS